MHHSVDSVSVGKFMAKSLKDVIEDYEQQRAELLAKLDRVDTILVSLRQAEAVATSEELANVRVPDPSRTDAPSAEGRSSAAVRRHVLTPDEVRREARAVLLENGKPLKRGAIVRAIEAKGLIVPGDDKAKNLGTILWRANGAFVSISGFGYWPADVSYGHLHRAEH